MAKITQTQRRLVASSIAFILTAAILMPTTTDARGGGGHGGGHGGVRNIGVLGFTHVHPSASQPGVSLGLRSFSFSPRRGFSHRQVAFRHSGARGSHFFTLGADGVWIDSFESAPTIVVQEAPAITQEPAARRHAAVVKTPSAEQEGILVVRGNSKDYVTFPSAKPG